MNNIDASHREAELQSDVTIKELNVKNDRLKGQLSLIQADHSKLLVDFEDFKTRARTVLKTRHDEPQEDTTMLKLQVRLLLIFFRDQSIMQVETLSDKVKSLTSDLAKSQSALEDAEVELSRTAEALSTLKSASELAKLLADEQFNQLRTASETTERELQTNIQYLRSASILALAY
jgi:hypothetical protein